jgi:hypothetical protein
MGRLVEFSLQKFERGEDGDLTLTTPVLRVVASTPEEAADILLGEQMHHTGDPRSVRAKVWCLDGNGKPVVTMLYSRAFT